MRRSIPYALLARAQQRVVTYQTEQKPIKIRGSANAGQVWPANGLNVVNHSALVVRIGTRAQQIARKMHTT